MFTGFFVFFFFLSYITSSFARRWKAFSLPHGHTTFLFGEVFMS
jgi:hypothetical protein